MNKAEALKAIAGSYAIRFKDEPGRWGIPTCLSDDETTIYYKPLGTGLTRSSATLDKVELVRVGVGS